MTGKVRGRWPSEHGLPTAAKPTEVEIAQMRDLVFEHFAVWQRRTDLTRGMAHQAGRRCAGESGLALLPLFDLVEPVAVTFFEPSSD